MRVLLTLMTGSHQGRSFTLEGRGTFVAGRSEAAHVRLPDHSHAVSRAHFEVTLDPPVCRLKDLGSRNGPRVNHRRVAEADLHDGDLIQAGDAILRVIVEPADGGSRSPEPCVVCGQPVAESAVAIQPTRWSDTPPVLCRKCWEASGAGPGSIAGVELKELLHRIKAEGTGPPHPPVAGYRTLKVLRRGHRGSVLLALREADAQLLALKTLHPGNAARVEQLKHEAETLKTLNHPNLVAFRELSESDGQWYLAVDYVPGTDAARLLKQEGPLPVARAVRLVCQVLDAVGHLHARGFVHRNLKPFGFVVTVCRGKESATLVNLGMACPYRPGERIGQAWVGDFGGAPAFLAPEQIIHFREAGPAADLYAAAATLYQLLTDCHVHDLPRSPEQRLMMILTEEAVPIQSRRPDIPDGLAAVIHRALNKEPTKRHPDARTMRRALEPFGR
jgi:eukaryotic-like serine/threonine-protein kinase